MNKKVIPPNPHGVQEIALREALEERYLAYALSTIMHRALPDARDGLKPVHRRILYGMRLLHLDPGAAFKKSAKIVGDVMGNFHPHGDQAIYDALVRLAQDFAQRYPLVDGQGNFGNIDGDNAAAYRYTEARLTEVARLLLDGIDEDAVDFRPNYDGVSQEPVVLPAAFPNLLANGSQGIAVGMATAIPPHNVGELCDAALHLIEQPNARSRTLLKYLPGPDLPTGGVIVDPPETIAEAYATGRGSFRLRAKWTTEDTGRGTYQVIVTEIPWQVQKMRLVERIAELMNEKKLPLLADMRDESAEDVRIVFEPRSRSVDPALLMESLFKLTELESRVQLNMNVLVRGRIPKVVGLAEALTEWLAHRREVLQRRSRFRLTALAAFNIVLLAILALIPLYARLAGDSFVLTLFTRVLILAIGAVSLNLIMGYGGMVSFGHAAYLGIGGYAVGILAKEGVASGFVQWPVAVGAAALFALVVGALSLRTRGVYFIMITLAFAQMIYFVAIGLDRYGGDDGLTIYERSQFGGILDLNNKTLFYYLCLALLVASIYLVSRLINSRFGHVVRGARSNERRMRAIGFPTFRYKLVCFVIAGALCGLAGALLANHTNFISPAMMHWTRSGDLIVMVVLGGLGSLFGPLIGAVTFLLLEEAMSRVTQYPDLILGPILLLVAIYARGGIAGLIGSRGDG